MHLLLSDDDRYEIVFGSEIEAKKAIAILQDEIAKRDYEEAKTKVFHHPDRKLWWE